MPTRRPVTRRESAAIEFLGLNSAVNRTTRDGRPKGGWLPQERLPLTLALETYTSGNAFAAREESVKGSLDPGMVADVVVLGTDILKAPTSELVDSSVAATIQGGLLVYERNSETSR